MFDTNLSELLDDYAKRVGLIQYQGESNIGEDLALPDMARVWFGHHAVLVVCLTDPEEAAFGAIGSACVRWLGEVLDRWRHQRGRLFDGYLVLALPQAPNENQRDRIKRFELEATICRRHIIWPEGNADWHRRVNEVTMLGLPTTGTVSPPNVDVELPIAAQQCLIWYGAPDANIGKVFGQLEAMAAKEAQAEVNRAG